MSGNPSRAEITQIFKRLRAIPANKVCFDCNCKNPTWSSITYGIFICIDCSGIHRSLGVHLTFVRSTQLDYNWTWQQLRQMQLGGNANAMAFFRKHNVSTADTAVKYKSRAAQLYRDNLHQKAAHAHRVHGTKLFIDTATHKDEEDQGEEEEDFFENHSQPTKTDNGDAEEAAPIPSLMSTAPTKTAINQESNNGGGNGGAPNVEAALSMSPTPQTEVRKSTIGQRKPLGKKTGLGAKKGGGLGAQKVKKSFAEIEREAEMADQIKERMEQERKVNESKRIEDEAVAAASMKLAYQDMSAKSKKAEEQIRRVDSKKADQFERLGMGAAAASSKSAISHSAVSDAIVQEEPVAKSGGGGSSRSGGFNASRGSSFMARDFEDDFEIVSAGDNDFRLGGSSGNGSRNRDGDDGFEGFGGGGGGSSSNWERDFEAMKLDSKKSRNNNTDWSNAFEEEPIKKQSSSFATSSSSSSRARPESLATPAAAAGPAVDVQKKFGSAKAISSDMVFGNQRDDVPDANLSRFQGSSSISSAEFFGREEQARGGGGGGYGAAANIQTPDMEDVKESVRQGVSKVAGKLSNMASGVMTQLQDKYGY